MNTYKNITIANKPCKDGLSKFSSALGNRESMTMDEGINKFGLVEEALWYVLQNMPEKILECHARSNNQSVESMNKMAKDTMENGIDIDDVLPFFRFAHSLRKQVISKDTRLAQQLAPQLIKYHGESTIKKWLLNL